MSKLTFRPQNGADFQAVVLGALGFSAKHIGEQTGLSNGQVYYRMRKAHLRLRDYRDGESPVAKAIAKQGKQAATKMVRHVLVAHVEL